MLVALEATTSILLFSILQQINSYGNEEESTLIPEDVWSPFTIQETGD